MNVTSLPAPPLAPPAIAISPIVPPDADPPLSIRLPISESASLPPVLLDVMTSTFISSSDALSVDAVSYTHLTLPTKA